MNIFSIFKRKIKPKLVIHFTDDVYPQTGPWVRDENGDKYNVAAFVGAVRVFVEGWAHFGRYHKRCPVGRIVVKRFDDGTWKIQYRLDRNYPDYETIMEGEVDKVMEYYHIINGCWTVQRIVYYMVPHYSKPEADE